jgi:hypothetical protein
MTGKAFSAVIGCIVLAASSSGCTAQNATQPSTPGANLRTASTATAVSAATLRTAAAGTRAHAPITFTLRGCPYLPAGLTVSGSGDDFLVVNARVDGDGVTYLERNDLVTGTATDSNGASYKFNYHNHASITIPPGGFPQSFTTTDHFNLVGNGQADQLHVRFVARVTIPSPTDPPIIEFVNSHGDPFFCDPI